MKKSQKQTTESVIDSPALDAAAAKQDVTKVDEPVAPSKKGKVSKAKPIAKAASGARAKANAENGQLVCRYCGSDDLAPSFIKRRDARCRACFKQRYGAAKRTQPLRKAAAAV